MGAGCNGAPPPGSSGDWDYTYDPENRLMTAGNGTVAAAFAYDPLGRRTEKSGTGVTTTFFLDDGDTEIAECDNSATVAWSAWAGPFYRFMFRWALTQVADLHTEQGYLTEHAVPVKSMSYFLSPHAQNFRAEAERGTWLSRLAANHRA